MQELRRPVDRGTEDDAQSLMAQADPEHRLAALGAGRDHCHRDSGFLWGTGTRRDQNAVEPSSVGRRYGVVACDLALGAELLEIAHDGEDEAVVVVDHKDARAASAPGTDAAVGH